MDLPMNAIHCWANRRPKEKHRGEESRRLLLPGCCAFGVLNARALLRPDCLHPGDLLLTSTSAAQGMPRKTT